MPVKLLFLQQFGSVAAFADTQENAGLPFGPGWFFAIPALYVGHTFC